MKDSHEKGVANHSAPSFALCAARYTAKRKQGVQAGWVLSSCIKLPDVSGSSTTQGWQRTVIVVRYADDIVLGFQWESDGDRFHQCMGERLRKCGLALHPDKTRRIEFGRYAEMQENAPLFNCVSCCEVIFWLN
jgi:Reverse transcriptase (RNA-dependent DNA polymerase)